MAIPSASSLAALNLASDHFGVRSALSDQLYGGFRRSNGPVHLGLFIGLRCCFSLRCQPSKGTLQSLKPGVQGSVARSLRTDSVRAN
jgi:hypothetical protein